MAITISLGDYPNTRPLVDGRVPFDGRSSIILFNKVDVLIAARRMCRELEYDVAEVPLATYLVAREAGVPITALPAFPNRALPHFLMYVRRGHRMDPRGLRGARIGVRAYTVTSAVWGRAVLQDFFGLELSEMEWIAAGEEHVAGAPLPPYVSVQKGLSLPDALAAGRLDAVVGTNIDLSAHPLLVPMFPEPAEAGRQWLRSGRPYPVNHTIVVRNDLLGRHPGYVGQLYRALLSAHTCTRDERLAMAERRFATGIEARYPHEYGWAHNRPAIAYLASAAVRQSLLRSSSIDDAFWRADD